MELKVLLNKIIEDRDIYLNEKRVQKIIIKLKHILQKLEKDVFLNALVRKLEKRLDASNTETVNRSIKITQAVEQLNLLSSEISKFGENIKKDHPDAEILISKLSDVTKSLEKIKIDLNIF